MTLPLSGPISMQDVNVELSESPTASITLNDLNVRTLFQVPSGTISLSDGYGKSAGGGGWISYQSTAANQAASAKTVSDAQGNIYSITSLYFTGTGLQNAILLKQNGAGEILWAKTFDTNAFPFDFYLSGLCVDQSGNVFVCGTILSYVVDGLLIRSKGFVAKFSSNGSLNWQASLGADSGYYTNFYAIDCNSSGDVFVVGYSSGTAFFGSWSTNGSLLFKYIYQPPVGTSIEFNDVRASGGDVIIGGTRTVGGSTTNPLIINCSFAGVQLSVIGLSVPMSTGDTIAINVDSSGNLYVATDTASITGYVCKIQSNSIVWQKEFVFNSGIYNQGSCEAVSVTDEGNVIIKAEAENWGSVFLIAYDPTSNGPFLFSNELWSETSYFAPSSTVFAQSMAIFDGNISMPAMVTIDSSPYVPLILNCPTNGSGTGEYPPFKYLAYPIEDSTPAYGAGSLSSISYSVSPASLANPNLSTPSSSTANNLITF